MSVFNGEKYLRATLESLLSQEFRDFEIICVDDGSTDGTRDILMSYSHNQRLHVHRQENSGLVAALNTGIRLSRADLIARIDADDIAKPERLSRQVAYMRKHPEVTALGSAITLMNVAGEVTKIKVYPIGQRAAMAAMYRGCALAHPSVMMRKSAVIAVGGYRPCFQHAEDYDLWLRLIEIGPIDNLSEPLIFYRIHDDSISSKHCARQAFVAKVALYAHHRRAADLPDAFAGQQQPISLADLNKLHLTVEEEADFIIVRLRLALAGDAKDREDIAAILHRSWELRQYQRRGRHVRHVLMPAVFAFNRNGHRRHASGWLIRAFATEPLSACWMLIRQMIKLLRPIR